MRVLLADDDAVARTLHAAVISDLGHDPVVAEDGERAWATFQGEPAPLAVIDINMPGLDGLTVCRLIREHEEGRDTFVIVVTARDTREDLTAVLAAGADDYVTKPVSPENLRARRSG
jgi:two-component system, cell cycle response regulator